MTIFDGRPPPAGVSVRPERSDDVSAIHSLTLRAFEGQPFSSGTEASIISDLRVSGNLTLSLVAESSGVVVGHIAFSPVEISGSGGRWFGLGPISVDPHHQRRGVGRALVGRGLQSLQERGAAGCALIGDPAVYGRFGFTSGGLEYEGVHPSLVQYVVLNGCAPRGVLRFGPSFSGQ